MSKGQKNSKRVKSVIASLFILMGNGMEGNL
jgi:hypothetical protein